MQYYKSRGRPDDPRNVAANAQSKALANTILVYPLLKRNYQSQDEVNRRMVHFEEFRKSYHNRSRGKSEVTKKVEDYKLVKKMPLLVRAPMRSIKTVPVEVPKFVSTAIYKPRFGKDEEALALLKKLQEMESTYKKPTGINADGQDDVMKAIVDTNNEINMANTQLYEIRKLLREKEKRPLSPVPEESGQKTSDSKEGKTKKITASGKGGQRVENVKKTDDGKKKKLVLTLTQLNARIQQMQDKYFNGPKSNYKSLQDYEDMNKFKKKIETIYKNNEFDPETEVSNILLENAATKNPQPDLKKCDGMNSKRRVFKIKKNSDSAVVAQYDFSTNVSSDNYLYNKSVGNDESRKVKFFTDTEIVGKVDNLNLILKPKPVINSDSDYDNDVDDVSESKQVSLGTDQYEGDDEDSAFKNTGLKESIFKSDFLMKEFGMNPKDMNFDLKTLGNKGKKSVRFNPQRPLNFQGKEDKRNLYLEDSIRQQLKNTLFEI